VSGRDQDRNREFVRDVLARTSGSACDRACGLLPDLTDGVLASLDRQLVQQHLEHCPGCRAVALALGWLGPELASRAVLEPGPGFTAAVMARTSARTAAAHERRARELAATGPGGLMDRVGRWWQDRVLRPGFALQAAYAATVVLVLLTATPVSPLRGAPRVALAVFSAGPEALPVVNEASTWLADRTDEATSTLVADARARADRAGSSLADRGARSAPERARCAGAVGHALTNLRAGRFGDAGQDILDALHAGRTAWTLWWTTHPANNG